MLCVQRFFTFGWHVMPHLMRHPACLREVPPLRDEGRALFFWIPDQVRNDNIVKPLLRQYTEGIRSLLGPILPIFSLLVKWHFPLTNDPVFHIFNLAVIFSSK
jgi:hypothetical protein